jgi:hypothetical protein
VEPLSLRLPAEAAVLAPLRRSVRDWLGRLEIVEPDVAAIVAACSEVAADAIESAPRGNRDTIEVEAGLAGGDVVVRCTGPHGWKIDEHPSRYVAALLVDDVAIDRSEDGTSVVLRKAASRGLRA